LQILGVTACSNMRITMSVTAFWMRVSTEFMKHAVTQAAQAQDAPPAKTNVHLIIIQLSK